MTPFQDRSLYDQLVLLEKLQGGCCQELEVGLMLEMERIFRNVPNLLTIY